jgi:hypothetical protein
MGILDGVPMSAKNSNSGEISAPGLLYDAETVLLKALL